MKRKLYQHFHFTQNHLVNHPDGTSSRSNLYSFIKLATYISQEYDEEEDEDNDSRYKKRRNERHGGFILDEAEVDDEVESEDEWEEGAQEIGIISHETDEHGPTAREIEGRRRGTSLWE